MGLGLGRGKTAERLVGFGSFWLALLSIGYIGGLVSEFIPWDYANTIAVLIIAYFLMVYVFPKVLWQVYEGVML